MEVTVRLVDMPESVGGCVSEDTDGTYSVYINSRWGYEAQRKALLHELGHIEKDDIDSFLPIQEVENL